MSDHPQDPGTPPGPGEPVGSVGEEAAKLFGALSTWARDQAADEARGPGAASGAPDAHGAQHAHDALRRGLHDVGEHLRGGEGPGATGAADGADCRYCPVCQVIHVVRQTSPEVRAHLASAAGSLMQAAAGFLATPPPSGERGPVEHIDLDDTQDTTSTSTHGEDDR